MKTYTKFLINGFIKSFLNVFFIMISLVLILNILKEIEFLTSMINPDYGLITNFWKAHLEGFGSIEGVIKGKSELYEFLAKKNKIAFINEDDEIQKKFDGNKVVYGKSKKLK